VTLQEYIGKRRFDRTREPRDSVRAADAGRPIFVVQLHHASHRHYDFRLQVGNALRSWAVPKGPSFDPEVKRLAAEVEDHPLGYASFEGLIPEGQYGGGHVAIFDEGVWSSAGDVAAQLAKGHLRFELFGRKLKGGWHLIRTRGSARKPQWLLVKDDDEYAGKLEADDLIADLPPPTAGASARRAPKPGRPAKTAAAKRTGTVRRSRTDWAAHASKLAGARRQAPPPRLEPQLATLVARPPDGDDWLHEIKWDGYRIGAIVHRGAVSLWSRNALDWTRKLPDIVAAIERLGLTEAAFDGELIAARGTQADFSTLQSTLSGERAATLSYVLFDVHYIDGVSLLRTPLRDRKALLAKLLAKPPRHLAFSSHIDGSAAQAFELARQQGFEGIISKRANGFYHEGRSGEWTKSKQIDSEEFAVVGVTAPRGSRKGLGALLLARHDPKRGWVYVGKSGSGLSDADLHTLSRRIGDGGSRTPTVDVPENDTDLRTARWFDPLFVVDVYSRGRGSHGLLRQPTVRAIRMDKSIEDLIASGSRRRTKAGRARSSAQAAAAPASIAVTHPDRVVYPDDGITKQQVADYYAAVMPQLLPAVADRPLSLIRCPAGAGGECFFQKHEIRGVDGVDHVSIEEKDGELRNYLVVRDANAVLQLVQFNALEFHPWGARAEAPDKADLLVFDLDPGPGVEWNAIRAAARKVRDLLARLSLKSFVRTSGGKGLHVVVPLKPAVDWDVAKPFAQSFAETMARMEPDKFVATATKSRREGRIFVDYLRNGRGATSVASYSLRARPGAPVAMPLAWEELSRVPSAAAFTLRNVPARLARRKRDPWAGFDEARQNLDRLRGDAAPSGARARRMRTDTATAKTRPAARGRSARR
jgi:bifunctional non-homologous end joining protein LigD